jgi:hypothetical protein
MSSRKTLVLEGTITAIDYGTNFSARIDTANGVATDEYAKTRDFRTGDEVPMSYGGSLIGVGGKLIPAVIGDRAKFVLTPDHQTFLRIYVNGKQTR